MATVVALVLLASVLAAWTSPVNERVCADEKSGQKARQAEPRTQNRGKLKALLTEQREFAKGQFAAWKNRAISYLTARKRARERAADPFAGGTAAEAALAEERRLQLDPLRASGLQLHLYQWSQRLLTAELELADKQADRVAVHEAHVLRMKEMEEAFKEGVKKGQPDVSAAEAAFHRLRAQVMLEREKGR
jgi:hypothetical protein